MSEPVPLVVWNREIAVFRATLGNFTPGQRLENTLHRMASVSDHLLYQKIRAEHTSFGTIGGVAFMIGDQVLFTLVEEDLDPITGETLESVSEQVLSRLEELREAKRSQRSLPMILRGVGIAVAATLGFVALVWILRWLGRRLRRFVTKRTAAIKKLKVRDFDLRPMMLQAFRRVLVIFGWLVALSGAYVWIGTVLAQFPYTAPWGHVLGDQVRMLGGSMLNGFV